MLRFGRYPLAARFSKLVAELTRARVGSRDKRLVAQPVGQKDVAAPAQRCTRCGAAVAGTRHTRVDWEVGHFALHTGRTVETAVRRREDEAPVIYRRLVEPQVVVSCPRCFADADVQRRWLAFGDEEPSS